MISLSDLLTAVTRQQMRATLVNLLVTMGVPADQWRIGGPLSSILTGAAYVLAGMSTLVTNAVASGFLPYATGAWLDLLAQFVFGVTRSPATAATGPVTIVNPTGAIYNVAPFGATFKNSTTGQTYQNTDAFTVNARSTLAGINVMALQPGAASSAPAGQIDTIVSPAMLNCTVSNPNALLGSDALADADLRKICSNKLGALSVRGPRSAYYYAIQVALDSVSGGAVWPSEINRWTVSPSSHTGIVSIVLAGPGGTPSSTAIAGVATSIEAIARPECVTVSLSAAAAVTYAPEVIVYCTLPSGTSAATAQAACALAVATAVSRYPIGGVLAGDNENPVIQGFLGDAVAGACAQAIAALGGTYYSTQGATNQALTAGQVATNGVTVSIRTLPQGQNA